MQAESLYTPRVHWICVNAAVTAMFPVMVTVRVVPDIVPSPDHPENV
jgi:hypothetical protein